MLTLPFEKMARGRPASRRKRLLRLGGRREVQIGVGEVRHQRLRRRHAGDSQRIDKAIAGHHAEIGEILHAGAQPRVFELFQSPYLGDQRAASGAGALDASGHGLDVV